MCIQALCYKANFRYHYVLKNSGLNNVHGQHVSVRSLNDRWRYFTTKWYTKLSQTRGSVSQSFDSANVSVGPSANGTGCI